MSDAKGPAIGTITWTDLAVPNAEEVRDFYREVVGWKVEPVAMKGYDDYSMLAPETGGCVAGICHARGPNADLPAQWLVYITVADAEASAARVVQLGGKLLREPKVMGGYGRICVIQDPAGAVAALFEPAKK